MRRLHVLLILYRQLGPVTNAISLLMWLLAGSPSLTSDHFPPFMVAFVWLRSFSQVLVWYLFRSFNRKSFVLYHHFGLSEMHTAFLIYLLDIIIFALWIILASLFIS